MDKNVITKEVLAEIVDITLQMQVSRNLYLYESVLKVGSKPNKSMMELYKKQFQDLPRQEVPPFNEWVVRERFHLQVASKESEVVKQNLELSHHLEQLAELTKALGELIVSKDFPRAVQQAETINSMYSEVLPKEQRPAYLSGASSEPVPIAVESTPVEPDQPSLNDLWDDYVKSWTLNQRGQNERKRWFARFKYFLGNTPVNRIDKKVLAGMFATLSRFPKTTRGTIYHKMTVEQLVEVAEEGELDETQTQGANLNHAWKHLNTFFGWCVDNEYLEERPQKTFDLPKNTRRGAFSYTQMGKLVRYAQDKKYWMGLVQFYSGARNGEIEQLRKKDIMRDEDTGILYIRITEEAGSLKTKDSNRRIPVHRELLEMGFEEWVNVRRDGRLFDGQPKLTDWYKNRAKPDLELPDTTPEGLPLSIYSARHRMNTSLLENGLHDLIIKQLMGHSAVNNKMTAHYAHSMDMTLLKGYIDRVSYI